MNTQVWLDLIDVFFKALLFAAQYIVNQYLQHQYLQYQYQYLHAMDKTFL